MADTLLAILFVSTSAKGSNLLYRWPKDPVASPRLSRPRPDCATSPAHLDNVWKAATCGEREDKYPIPHSPLKDPEYEWKRELGASSKDPHGGDDSDDIVFGYSASFLANLLCPQRSMCHQRCEVVVDDLTFIGHPVCADTANNWNFRQEKQTKSSSRGRETRHNRPSEDTVAEHSPDLGEQKPLEQAWLTSFNLVLVLDEPDPSSVASGNFLKYLDVIYRQVAFTTMAVLFQQQVTSNFVEAECNTLESLRNACISKGQTLDDFQAQALSESSIALAMKDLYEAIKSSSVAYITINNIPLELQLPPHLDRLLYTEEDEITYQALDEDDAAYYKQAWGDELTEPGWNLPSLDPWKSLLMLDDSLNIETPFVDKEDMSTVEGLMRFMELADVTLSLGDMASLLDWDYDTQVVPTVRWLVQHRRAKVVDLVQGGMKTVFTLPPQFSASLLDLSEEFDKEFKEQHPEVMSLPKIMSAISTSASQSHFFASVVQTKDNIPLYHDVVVWMLKHELLVTLHLRVRVVATGELKQRVKNKMKKEAKEKERAKKLAAVGRGRSKLRREIDAAASPPVGDLHTSDEDEDGDPEHDDGGWDTNEDDPMYSIIPDPGRANKRQTRWLIAMSDGKEKHIVDRFNQILQYFDGKHTDDEILFKAEIPRKGLRQILHHYDEYLQTFLHP
ncbi:hypothetical protein CYLTODRAFT_342484 [Cylindrobasidium torrendii FP15055 ss-10]|uniref:Nitrogen permease regulator 3 n=1 Tax=Cylindrobasidium torrendii FP15055 ss-10 TaxID=1314674 RepID=A0A0D7BS43_9AGAR|nr:hypothetical protein CYLTODRAFT_342484 [Cylindrobasidium torrendii FP15055 ss-10]